MDAGKLAHMGHQIADFFRSYPEDEAVAGIREHIRQFWTPKMLADARAASVREPGAFDPLVVKALAESVIA